MFIFSSGDNENSDRYMPTDFEIDKIEDDPESIAYGLYTILLSYEDHYNKIQNKYKGLAVTWVIATYIAIGYIISGFEKALPINSLLLIMFICFFAAQGIFLLWFLDAGVYDALIKSIWEEIFLLEQKFSELGYSHHIVGKYFKKEKDEPKLFHGYFYAYFILFLLITGIVSIGLYLYFLNKWAISIVLFFCVIILGIIHYYIKKSPFKSKKR